jgi:pyruvate dehydrogenase E1 component alpha subunit
MIAGRIMKKAAA